MEEKTVFLATYSVDKNGIVISVCGPISYIVNYLKNKYKKTFILEQPLPQSSHLIPEMTFYENGKLMFKKELPRYLRIFYWISKKRKDVGNTVKRLKIRDIIADFYFVLTSKEKVDIFIAVESINAICGIILRALGKVDKVVYYIIDYFPDRYANPMINNLYLKLDEIAAYNSDFIWNNSPYMHDNRLERGMKEEKIPPRCVVPSGCSFDEAEILDLDKRKANQIIYSGNFIPNQGIEITLRAMPKILEEVKDASLVITGSGPERTQLEQIIDELGLKDHVKFTGFISEEELHDYIRNSWVGVAPFLKGMDSSKRYADPGKIRRYLAFGVPVVTTDLPYVSALVGQKQAGIVIEPNVLELSGAILKILKSKEFAQKCITNAIDMARNTTWEDNWDRAFASMQEQGILN